MFIFYKVYLPEADLASNDFSKVILGSCWHCWLLFGSVFNFIYLYLCKFLFEKIEKSLICCEVCECLVMLTD